MCKKICIFSFSVTCVLTLVCIPGSYSSGNCPILDVTNGYTRYSGAGRIVRFFCYKPYVLVGSSSAFCSHGEWNNPPPFCGSTNCSSLGRIIHGSVTFSFRGAVATSSCESNFTLIGSSSLLCSDNGWNDSIPVCQANSLLQFGTCHFEPKENQECNWILKPALFKWTVMSSDQHNFSDMGSYPGFDHTLGPHSGGHYLYLNNAMPMSSISLRLEQRPDNGAKYISPLFPAIEGTEEWCLIFFIYSFGPNAGNVKVTINNDTVWENLELMRRNYWTKVTITLVHQRDPFRITIVGKGSLGQLSNTAIDDLRIAHGSDCLDKSDEVLPYSVEPGLETEPTTLKTESTKNHEVYKRETTTEATETSQSTSTEMIRSTSDLFTTEVTSTTQNISPESSSESHTKVDIPSSMSTETTSTSDDPTSSAQSTFTATSSTVSSTITLDSSPSSTVNTSTDEDVILLTTSVTGNESPEISSSYDSQSTESSLNSINSSTLGSSFPVSFLSIDDSKPKLGMSMKSENISGWSDWEKSLVYLALVIASTIILIISIIVIRYRNHHSIRMSDKKVSYNNEHVAFLNGVELLDKF